MEHIKLYENFDAEGTGVAQEILSLLKNDPDYANRNLSLKDGMDVKFIVWENPESDQQWLSSGYGEYHEEGDDASMPILAINNEGDIFKLAPEEKYSYTYSEEGNSGNAYGENGEINYPKVKADFEDSIWNYEG